MRCNWNKNSILTDIKFLEKQLKTETNPLTKNEINSAIKQCYYLLTELNIVDMYEEETTESELYERMYETYYKYLPYENLITSFDKNLKKFEIPFTVFDYDYVLGSIPQYQHFEFIHDFYKSLNDKDIFNAFLTTFNNRKTQYKFKDDEGDYYAGITYSIPYLNKFYVSQIYDRKSTDVNNLLTGVHEYGHVISDVLNPKNMVVDSDVCEIETLFFELVATDYYSKILGTDKFYLYSLEKLKDYYEDNKINKYVKKEIEKYQNLMKYGISIDNLSKKDQMKFSYNIEYDQYTKNQIYTTCYMIALNLYMIYLKDKEKALYILKQIIKSDKYNEQSVIFENISLESEALNYGNHIKKLIK